MSNALQPPAGVSYEQVRNWCISLGVLTATNMSRQEAELKLAGYVPFLANEFPAPVFCQASLSYVARRCPYFPSYGQLCDHLRDWWRDNRPLPPLLPAREAAPLPPREPPTPEEIAHVHACVLEIMRSLAKRHEYTPGVSRPLPNEPRRVTPHCLPPDMLDRMNPLPNGRKRTDAADAPADAVLDTAPSSADTNPSSADSTTTFGATTAADP